ncbi:MAG: HNH endonuclease [Planctomycetota bacterium]
MTSHSAEKSGCPLLSPVGKNSEVFVDCVRNSKKEIDAAWSKGGFSNAERAALEEEYVWHHTIDLQNKQVKMQLVRREVHDSVDGYVHTGGSAVSDWLIEKGIDF